MRFESIRLGNFQSFSESGRIPLGQLTLLVGRNNSGKSAVLNAIRQMQTGLALPSTDLIRIGAPVAEVWVEASDIPDGTRLNRETASGTFRLRVEASGTSLHLEFPGKPDSGAARQLFSGTLPEATVMPLLVERSLRQFDEQVNRERAALVRHDSSNISAILSRITNASDPRFASFAAASTALLGFQIGLVGSQNGQLPGMAVDENDQIAVSAMGTGVLSLVRMVAYLLIARGKIILMEEPENDLHPEALKFFLEMVVQAARQNQVLVTTHSHIVVNTLGSVEGAAVYRVAMHLEHGIPTTAISPVESSEGRMALLRELGHEFTDLGLHEGFLVLEESSAESILHRVIAWFTPRLVGRLRTVAASGAGDVESRFTDLHRVFVFVNLQGAAYRDRAWVLVDGDEAGQAAIQQLRAKFATWPADHFRSLARRDIELYFPPPFTEKVASVLAEPNSDRRRHLKKQLVVEVVDWCDSNPDEARKRFEETAAELIEFLREIESKLVAVGRALTATSD